MVITWGQQCNTGEKPNVIRHTYINRHEGHKTKTKHKRNNNSCSCCQLLTFSVLVANAKNWKKSVSWSAEQQGKNKTKVWQRTLPPTLLVRIKEKKRKEKKRKEDKIK